MRSRQSHQKCIRTLVRGERRRKQRRQRGHRAIHQSRQPRLHHLQQKQFAGAMRPLASLRIRVRCFSSRSPAVCMCFRSSSASLFSRARVEASVVRLTARCIKPLRFHLHHFRLSARHVHAERSNQPVGRRGKNPSRFRAESAECDRQTAAGTSPAAGPDAAPLPRAFPRTSSPSKDMSRASASANSP